MNEEFSTISDILNDKVFDTKKGLSSLKYSTIFSFWPQIVGQKFKNSSKPVSIKSSKMYVACENSYVVQELLMYKKNILQKLKIYCEPLNISVIDIVFSYKNWQCAPEEIIDDEYPEFYRDEELLNVDIDIGQFSAAFANIDDSAYLTDEQKKKFKERIIKLQRAKKLREM